MNPVIVLQKLFGSKNTKIKAIGFEIEKLQEEISFFVERFNTTTDTYEKQYYERLIDDTESLINQKHEQIERLHHE